jgi:O-antigen/teichoic acid export membrane protein
MSSAESRATFFRQSGWMAFATIAGGLFNMLSTLVVFKMPDDQVNAFDAALAALAIFGTPALGMQAAFAAQASVADDPDRMKSLAATMRGAFLWLTAGWAALAVLSVLFKDRILSLYGLSQPAFLWVLLALALVTLWTPVTNGTLQGRQDFLWFGLGTLLNGAGRLAVLVAVVLVLKLGALGGLVGVLGGSLAVFVLVTWRTRDVLATTGGRVDWRSFLRRAVPLTFGLGALVAIMQADALIVREKLKVLGLTTDEIVGYTAARRIGQVLVFVVGAVVSVMYPKVARSFQRTEATDVLKLTVSLTALVSIVGATVTSLVPQIPLRILAGSGASAESATLVVAFVWALVPLAISNVLVWNLLARECYRAVPFLVLVAGGCWLALRTYNDRLLTVITVVGISALAMLLVSTIFILIESRDRRGDRAAITS